MVTFTGMVSGIDVIATPRLQLRCLAFVGNATEEIQVETEQHALQTALELASCSKSEVEISYDELGPARTLIRVRLLDR